MRIFLRGTGEIRHRRELLGGGEPQGHDVNLADVRGEAADFDLGDARDDLRRPDGDQQFVGPGVAFEKYVGATDVGCERRCGE